MAEENESSAEKSEEPTQKRLEKAREEGEIARSKELNTVMILLAGSGGLILFGQSMADRIIQLAKFNFSLGKEEIFNISSIFSHFSTTVSSALLGLVPFFLLLIIAAFVGPMALGGWLFSPKSIHPKLSRLSPLSGLKRMFGLRALMELAKALAKFLLVAVLAFFILWLQTDTLLSISLKPLESAISVSASTLAWSFLALSCTMILIAAVDIPFQLQQHKKKLRMTLQQIKDEFKDTEGRPEVKRRIRQLQQEAAQNRMMSDIPTADVVITNPTHYAVVLKYDDKQQGAPLLVAKGGDFVAQKIREVAEAHDIPIISVPPLARAVFHHTDIGQEIPEGLYLAVAQVLAYIYQLNEYSKRCIKKPKMPDNIPIPEELRWDD